MGERNRAFAAVLPKRMGSVARSRWIPWAWILECHSASSMGPLFALFEAYRFIDSKVDLKRLSSLAGFPGPTNCRRCGSCCAELNPGPFEAHEYNFWTRYDSLTRYFVQPAGNEQRNHQRYEGWYYEGVRLRMCPMFFSNGSKSSVFCSIYHCGSGYRPEACERFRPNYPHCEISQRPLVF
ncbi:MAG: hypothetical protein GXP52_02300 [Deltaproteobacteria bacterium]|nr:hypothetical protein [Deltaproteobacteria bacterium]